jgi:hypothetical protein
MNLSTQQDVQIYYYLPSHFVKYSLRRNVFQINGDLNDNYISCHEHVFAR